RPECRVQNTACRMRRCRGKPQRLRAANVGLGIKAPRPPAFGGVHRDRAVADQRVGTPASPGTGASRREAVEYYLRGRSAEAGGRGPGCSLGEARSFVGTEGFIPPEGPGTPQADLYSLGIVLYAMSTGKSHQDFPEPLPDLTTRPENARWLELDAIILK